jgi:hypothetical protein
MTDMTMRSSTRVKPDSRVRDWVFMGSAVLGQAMLSDDSEYRRLDEAKVKSLH